MVNLKFKMAILEAGLTQKKIAKESGLQESIISLVSRGRYNPDSVQRAKIARAIGRLESELFEPTAAD